VIVVYIAFLMPYVVVSYYDRYKFPIMGTEVILLVWGIDRLVRWAAGGEWPRRPTRSASGSTFGGGRAMNRSGRRAFS